MNQSELGGFDGQNVSPRYRPLAELQGYGLEEVEKKADMLGLTLGECEAICLDLGYILTDDLRQDKDRLRRLTRKSQSTMEGNWIASGRKTTKAEHTDIYGQYTPTRTLLHGSIVEREVSRAPSRLRGNVSWLIIAGATGSGKSVERTQQQAISQAVITDPDEVRKHLMPEEPIDSLNARATHTEAGDISDRIFQTALLLRKPIVSETTMRDRRWFDTAIPQARDAGYQINILYLHTQYPFCFAKSLMRGERPIPPDVLLSCSQGIRNFLDLEGRTDIHSLYVGETASGRVVGLEDLKSTDPLMRDMQRHINRFSGILS